MNFHHFDPLQHYTWPPLSCSSIMILYFPSVYYHIYTYTYTIPYMTPTQFFALYLNLLLNLHISLIFSMKKALSAYPQTMNYEFRPPTIDPQSPLVQIFACFLQLQAPNQPRWPHQPHPCVWTRNWTNAQLQIQNPSEFQRFVFNFQNARTPQLDWLISWIQRCVFNLRTKTLKNAKNYQNQ